MKGFKSGIVLLLGIISILFFRLDNHNWGNGKYGVISYDDFGYYLYLPATFIYNDPTIKNRDWVDQVREKYKPSPAFYQAHPQKRGTHVIQYTMGMSIMYAPAFFLSHLYCLMDSRYEADGFSTPYQLGLLIYSFLWLIAGLFLLRRFLLYYFNDGIVALLFLILLAGTNYFQLTLNNTTSPHIFLFTNYVVLLLLTREWYTSKKFSTLITLSIVFGIQVLSRPNEALFFLIILFWGVNDKSSFKDRINLFRSKKGELIKASLIVIGIGLLQCIYWLASSGKLVYDSYIFEDFKFADPYLAEFLFSYKKGWFIYTPLAILFFISYLSLYKRNRELFLGFFLFGIVNVWILSSWDCWWYADSFSQRSVAQSLPLYLFPLGYFLEQTYQKKYWYWASLLSVVILCGISLNVFQTWQQWVRILHTSRMTKDYYWAIFGETEPLFINSSLLEYPRGISKIPTTIPANEYSLIYYNGFQDQKTENRFITDGALKLNKDNLYGPKFSTTFEQIAVKRDFYYVLKLRFKSESNITENPFTLITEVEDSRSGKTYGWGSYDSERLDLNSLTKQDGWYKLKLIYVPPYYRSIKDSIYSYIVLRGEHEMYIDDFSVELLSEKENQSATLKTYFQNFNTIKRGRWSSPKRVSSDKSHQLISKNAPYSSTLFLGNLDHLAFKRLNLSVNLLNTDSPSTFLIVSIEDNSKKYFYRKFKIPTDSDWQTFNQQVKILENYPSNSKLKYYLMNESDEMVYVNYLKLEFDQK